MLQQGWQVSAFSSLNCSLNCPGRNRCLPHFLPKHNKCSNILDKSTHTHFSAEQTQMGDHLLSIQPGLTQEYAKQQRWLLHFCVLTLMLNYDYFYNLAGVTENAQGCYSVCLVRFMGNPVVMKEIIPLYQYLWSPYVIGQTIIFSCCGLFFFFFLFFSSPNVSRRRLDVCHTSTHGVALV